VANGADERLRIVLAGYEGEGHEALEAAGWRSVGWYKRGFLRGGMGNLKGGGQQHRERLWLSPHCLVVERAEEQQGVQRAMFAVEGDGT